MDQILLCSNQIPLTTSINNSFIQKYMLDANGSYVKVYLYLSMCIQSGERNLSISSLADMMENTEKDIIRALRYWEKKELMVLRKDASGAAITGIEMINPDSLELGQVLHQDSAAADLYKTSQKGSSAEANPEAVAAKNTKIETVTTEIATDTKQDTKAVKNTKPIASLSTNNEKVSDSSRSSQTELSEIKVTEEQTLRLAKDEDFSWACLIVESYLERPLKTAEVQLLTYLFDTVHFSKELLLYLYEYCCSLGKTNINYVQAVALAWAKQNITTPEQAKEHSSTYSTAHTAIAKALALGRSLAKIECAYVDRWQNEWHMDLAVILEACNRTMLAIQKADFKYIEGILGKWQKENVHTLQDVQICDEAHNQKKAQRQQNTEKAPIPGKPASTKRTQFQAFQQRDSSKEEIDQLEKMLLTR